MGTLTEKMHTKQLNVTTSLTTVTIPDFTWKISLYSVYFVYLRIKKKSLRFLWFNIMPVRFLCIVACYVHHSLLLYVNFYRLVLIFIKLKIFSNLHFFYLSYGLFEIMFFCFQIFRKFSRYISDIYF